MSYKKWVYKYKYLKTEEEEFAEKMQMYTIKFNKDFITSTPPPQELTHNSPPQDSSLVEEETLESKQVKKGKN